MTPILRNEHYDVSGSASLIEVLDVLGTVTYRHTVDGQVVEERPATTDERAAYADEVKQQRIDILGTDFTNGVKTLRLWANQAQGTTVTNQNAVATLQIVVDRLGLFFDRFADLLVLLDKADIDDFD